MASRRLADMPIGIPANATTIEFPRSDGSSRQWPPNTTHIVDGDGQVNYMDQLDLDAPTPVKWRLQVARAIALDKGMPENQEYVLAGWPEGYRMFDHNKGPANNPRHDVYLFGSPKGRFRSINEFIPHAIWLLRDESMEHASCLCKYCSKKAQKEITASMSNILRSSPTSQSPSPSRVKPVREKKPRQSAPMRPRDRMRDTRTYAAIQRRPEVTKQAMLVERNSDLRAIFSKTDMKLKRWFREGELVWCALDRSVSSPGQHEDASIKIWPALVDEVRLKSRAVSRDNVPDVDASSKMDIEEDDGRLQETPWTVQQYYSYKVHLLVVNKTLVVPDEKILPYQAYVPHPELLHTLQAYSPEKLNFDRDTMRRFDPCVDHPVDFSYAVAPYAMGLQIGSVLSSFWCLTDEWTTTFTVPQRHPLAAEPSTATSLQDAIVQAHRHNASIPMTEPSSSTAPNRNGIRMPEPGTLVTQVRYQGLWWGGERIWADDFIRLKVPRRCLAPKGADNVYPPSGPGKTAREMWIRQGRDPSELGAGARGIFMRLDGLMVVDVTQPDGKVKKECRACGMLYELADLDWEDPGQGKRKQGSDAPSGSSIEPQALYTNGSSQQENTLAAPSLPPTAFNPTLPGTEPATGQATTPLAMTSGSVGSASGPSKIRYPLPDAPEGYWFRPILPEGHEAVISLSLISGRYYPRILSHPLLDDIMRKALVRPAGDGGLLESNNLWALEGLAAGFYNSVDPTHYRGTRSVMVEEADRLAREQIEEYMARQGRDESSEMEVDG
ncbi:hypothetical protein APHAL10511_004281 [Amanita phalloides]|nr:hypothetical protein APHAL10511_004281 [Amanita phalloides]